VSTSLALGTIEVAGMIRTLDPQEIMLPNEELNIEEEVNKATISTLKGVGLILAVLPSEALHTL